MSFRFAAPLVLGLGFVGCADNGDVPAFSEDPAPRVQTLEGDVDGVRGIHRIDGVDPSLPSTRDLQPLRSIIGGARMIGLGENVHTSGGFHQAHERIVKFMVQEMGFRVLALETPRVKALAVTNYVATCQGDPTQALRGIYGVFASTNMRNLVTWMCQWNTEHPSDPVRFVGFDMKEPWSDHLALEAFLREASPADAEALIAGLSTCDAIKAISQADYNENYAHLPFPQSSWDACHRGLDAIEAYWKEHEREIVRNTSRRALGWGRVALVSFRYWQSRKFYPPSSLPSYQARDSAMAYILEKQRELDFPHVKTAVWAHNGHLVYTPYRLGGGFSPEGCIPMGAQLKERLGHEYEAIAFTAYDTWINWPPDPPMQILPPPSAGAVEDKLHQLGENYLLVDLKHVSRRFIEPGKEYEISFVKDVPTEAYRAVLYLGYSPPMDALFW